MASMLKKAVSVILAIAVIANMVLFGFRKISLTYFWAAIAVAAILAYIVLPRMKK